MRPLKGPVLQKQWSTQDRHHRTCTGQILTARVPHRASLSQEGEAAVPWGLAAPLLRENQHSMSLKVNILNFGGQRSCNGCQTEFTTERAAEGWKLPRGCPVQNCSLLPGLFFPSLSKTFHPCARAEPVHATLPSHCLH